MATAVDSTRTPVVHTGLLPLAPFTFRPVPPVDDTRSAVELLDEIRREIEAQEAAQRSSAPSARPEFYDQIAKPELPHEPLLPARSEIRANDLSALAFHGDTPICATVAQTSEPLAPHGGAGCFDIATPSDTGLPDRCSAADIPHDAVFDLPEVGDLKTARTLYFRRQLAEAAEHGAALLAALGLPRLVTVDFVPIDPVAIGDALDLVIATLDDLDGDTDLGDSHDAELDTTDDEDDGTTEPSLGAPERHPYTFTVSNPYYQPANGSYYRAKRYESQVSWAQGSRDDREADPHDGPIDEDELDDDGLSKAEGDDADHEPSLASPIGDGDQRRWTQGGSRDTEDATEGEGQPAADWYARPIGPLRPHIIGYDHDRDMRALSRRADDVRRRLRPGPSRPDPDTVIPIGPGVVWWAGPAL